MDMTTAIFPLSFANDEISLLTAIGLGFLFGFSLERGGFGNARKLAAQFYFYDMTVFKVMFTAILVAMLGLFILAEIGWMDISIMWINPTFLWAQLVGGFLLGVGFVMSGLCPGTSVVSAASGRWDAVATMLGIFVGVAVFAVAVATLPPLEALYGAGSMDVSLLSDIFHLPPLVFALIVVAVAGAGFIGAEKVEAAFAGKYAPIELTPPDRPRLKYAMVGVFALVALIGLGAGPQTSPLPPVRMASLSPLALASEIIERHPNLMILDTRPQDQVTERIPGAYPAPTEEAALSLLKSAPPGGTVVLVDGDGGRREVPGSWPRGISYSYLEDGFLGWQLRVLTPALPGDTEEQRIWAARQNQISGYFTGAAVQTADVPPPPAMGRGAGAKPKKKGGC
jgi:uncharacterized membrane protein YedE/YeeE/rhodanese-related sulfurtransferase